MKYIIYVILVALVTMLLSYLGYLQEKGLSLDLSRKLYNKCSLKVLKYLKKKGNATIFEIQDCIKDVNASIPWSRKKIVVTNPSQFSQYVVENLYNNKKISIQYKGNTKIYSINTDKN